MEQFRYKKKYGQNFLSDNNIVKKIVSEAEIDNNTLVLEIGPGQGVMSKEIIPRAGFTILYEIDRDLEKYLVNLDSNNNYKIIFGDFLKADIESCVKQYKYDKLYVVANLPYYITTPIINKFIDDKILPDRFVIMVQREVADRLSARNGNKEYSALTVLLNYYYDIRKLCDVSRKCFIPKPNVDSAVIIMDIKKNRCYLKDEDFFKKIVRDSFKFKRKNIKNNLKKYDLNIIDKILKERGYSLNNRAEDFELEVFVDISNELI